MIFTRKGYQDIRKTGPLTEEIFFFSRQLIFCVQMLLTVEERN